MFGSLSAVNNEAADAAERYTRISRDMPARVFRALAKLPMAPDATLDALAVYGSYTRSIHTSISVARVSKSCRWTFARRSARREGNGDSGEKSNKACHETHRFGGEQTAEY